MKVNVLSLGRGRFDREWMMRDGKALVDRYRAVLRRRGLGAIPGFDEVGETELDAINLLCMTVSAPSWMDVIRTSSIEDNNNLAMHIHWLARWADTCCPTFVLTHGLCASLLLTDPTGLDFEQVRPPFKSFLVCLPWPSNFMAVAQAHSGEVHPARYVAYHEYMSGRTETDVQKLNEATRALDGVIAPTAATMRAYAERVAGVEFKAFCRVRTFSEYQDIYHRGVAFETSESFRDFQYSGDNIQGMEAVDTLAMDASMRLLVNLCAYLKGIRHPSTQPHARATANGSIRSADARPSVWLLGKDIKLSADMRQAAEATCSLPRATWKAKHQFVVRGHWRQQACGPQLSERRATWIAPYRKGPADAAAELVRSYVDRESA